MGLTLLALDTSTEACSVALLRHGKIWHQCVLAERAHTECILPLIDAILANGGCCLTQLDAIAFTHGPGSFTGIRIGIGIAQGLAFGADKPLIALSTLETLAQGAYRCKGATRVVSAIDARMNEVYIGSYCYQQSGQWQLNSVEQVLAPEEVAAELSLNRSTTWFAAGSGFQTYATLLPTTTPSGVRLPDAQDMIPLAEYAWQQCRLISADAVEPVYLRNKVAWKKLAGRE